MATSMSTLPIGLTDSQLKILFDLSRPLNVRERGRFMELVGERLRGHGGELGEGVITQDRARMSARRVPAAVSGGGCSAAAQDRDGGD
jgi:hypothetical protein